ncbi:hypothetical protein BGX28_000863 [Mortierella sp. GBA30]|nr:hypothetical protein BGX28_000863 [Mortierella sp. GBA30]
MRLCENGSLRSLCKNFGKLPEHLGAMYITQVLDGLIYLHDQGVIHRDIKGANILATKDGLVKLADFGVATLSADVGDMSVAGTPYWMAPEIIELSGATTASDIWSVGCTVIELLDGEPPYHTLPPMGALYRIVQDDHPPIPESVSACFQKDCNLRVSAKKLSKHPWIQMSKKKASGSQRSREKAIPAYEEAVKSVQQWNEALKGSSTMSLKVNVRRTSGGRTWDQSAPAIADLFHAPRPQARDIPAIAVVQTQPERPIAITEPPPQFHLTTNNNTNISTAATNNLEPEVCTDNWDDDFAEISSLQLAALEFRDQEDEISKTIRAAPRLPQLHSAAPENDVDEDDFEDDGQDLRLKLKVKALENKIKQTSAKQQEAPAKPSGSLASRPKASGPHVPIDLVRSRSAPGQLVLSPPLTSEEFRNYREEDDDDFSDLFEGVEGKGAMYQDEGLALQTRLSNRSWFGNDAGSDEDDPFAEVDEGFDEIDLEANIAREKYARACANIAEQFRLLEGHHSEAQLQIVCDRLTALLTENPDMRGPMIANHGAIPLLDLIETCKQESLVLKLLNILNLVIRKDFALQENLCLVGAIPVLIRYTSKRFSKEIQLAAAIFIQQICHTNPLTLQMFISCRGLRVLIEFLQGNYSTQKELVWIAINGIHSVFNLQSLTPRNDFCRLLAKQGLLDPLSLTLYNTIQDPQGSAYTEKIVNVLLIFSQGDSPVKELLATRQIVHCMLSSLHNLPAHLCVMMLKCIKNISMNSNTLDILQAANAIRTLVQVLGERTGSIATDVCNHVLTTLFNLCRINKSRQEEAAQAGLIPHLQQIAESPSPLKQFALPILCDMAHAGRACRNILWNNDCLPVYLRLFKDPYWQVTAMDAVHVWLQDQKTMPDEQSEVEQVLLQTSSLNLFVQAFRTATANSFENILEPLHKIIRISPAIACGIAVPALFQKLLNKLSHHKAVVRLNLLRILRAIFDVHPERLQLLVRYGISDVVVKIAEEDSAVLVKELAKEILDAFEESDSEAALSIKEDDGEHSNAQDGASSNPYDSFASSCSDFFGLRPLTALRRDNEDDNIHELRAVLGLEDEDVDHTEDTTAPALNLYTGNRHRLKSIGNNSQGGELEDIDDLFQKEVEELEIKTGVDPRTSSHQRSHDRDRGAHGSYDSYLAPNIQHSGNGEGSSTSAAFFGRQKQRGRLLSSLAGGVERNDNNNSNNSDSGDSEDELFVTSRGWLEQQEDGGASAGDDAGDRFNDFEDNEPRTVKMDPRQFGHQKSRSLGEIIESCLDEDNEKRRRLLQGMGMQSQDLSESMILRSELPKLRLELLDIDHFPAWNRQDFEVDGTDDDDDDRHSDRNEEIEDNHKGSSDSDVGNIQGLLSQYEGLERSASPRSSGDRNGITSTEELTKILEEYHGTRRRTSSMGERMNRNGSRSCGSSSGDSSGRSSGNPTIRLGAAAAASTATSSSSEPPVEQQQLYHVAGLRTGQQQRRDNRVVGLLASIAAWNSENEEEEIRETTTVPQATATSPSAQPGLTLVARQEYDSVLNFSDDEEESHGTESTNISNDQNDNNDHDHDHEATFTKKCTKDSKDHDDDISDDDINGDFEDDGEAGWTLKLKRLELIVDIAAEEENINWDDEEERLGCDTPRYQSISSTVVPASTLRRRNSHLRCE